MDINELKKMMRSRNDKVVIIENGKPILVVMPYEGYEQMPVVAPQIAAPSESKSPALQEPQSKSESPQDKLNLNDLPFL